MEETFLKTQLKQEFVYNKIKQRGDSQFLAETQIKNEILRLFAGSG